MDIELEETSYTLRHALLIYGGSSRSESVVTQHPVKQGVIQPGTPIDLEAYLGTLRSPDVSSGRINWTHPHQLASGPGWLCWWRPAARTPVYVSGKPRRACIPPLLFVAGSRPRVWVLGKNLRPTSTSALYLTGYANSYDDGGVCQGSGHRPTRLDPREWEDAFFASSFTSPANLLTHRYVLPKDLKKAGTLATCLAALGPSAH